MKKIYVIATSAAGIVAALLFISVWLDSDTEEVVVRKVPVIMGDVDFTMKAVDQDALGVAVESAFTLEASTPVDHEVIKGNLVITPSIEYALASTGDKTYTIQPKEKLADNTIYSFTITAQPDAAEQQRSYQWAFQTTDTFKVMSTVPRNQGIDVPINSGIEIAFSHENYAASVDQFVSITPAVEGRFERYRKTLVFVPDGLAASTVYTVRVKAGLPLDGADQTLANDYEFQFETAGTEDTYSYFDFSKSFFEYPESEAPVVTVRWYDKDATEVSVGVYAFDSFEEFSDAVTRQNNAPYWSRFARRHNSFPIDSLEKHAAFEAEVKSDDAQRQYLEFPEALPKGYYLIDIPIEDYHAQAFVQIGKLAASYQSSTVNSFIWLHDISTDQPVNGADITFSHNESFTARTNADGLATFDTPDEITRDEDNDLMGTYFYTIATATDKLLVPVIDYYEFGWSSAQRDYWTYLYTNRTLYSPDDSVKFWGVIKPRSGVGTVQEVEAQFFKTANYVTSQEDELIDRQKLPVSSFGTFQGSIDYTHLNPGGYRLEVLVDGHEILSTYVSVATYTKPAYTIDATPRQKAIFQGDNAIFDIQTKFFDGTPVGNLELQYMGALGEGKITTDQAGRATVTLATSFNDSSYYPQYEYFSVHPTNAELTDIYADAYVYSFGPRRTIEGAVSEEGSVSGSVHLIDLEKINASGDDFVWDYSGDPVAGADVTITMFHEYHTKTETGTRYDFISKKTYKTYDYESHSDQVEQVIAKTDTAGAFTGKLNPQSGNNYKVEVKTVDPDGRNATRYLYLYQGGGYDYYWGEGYLQYHLERSTEGDDGTSSYQDGETVAMDLYRNEEKLTEQSSKNILYFKGQRGFFDLSPTTQPSTTFTMTKDYAPNIYVYAVFFDGRSYYMTDSASVAFDHSQKELSIDITQDHNTYRPGDTVKLGITVTDVDDQPVSAEVNISAIDEALAAIQWENSNAILDELYRNIPRPIIYSYMSHEQALKPMAEGGGCFSGETDILMADGAIKSIADVQIGDMIATFTSPADHTLVPARVFNTLEHSVSDYLVINGDLTITPEHIVWLNNQWQPVGNAQPGDRLINAQGERIVVETVVHHYQPLTVYNLHVADYHTFIANGIYVHNEKGGGRQNFQDVAVFESVITDRKGHASVEFKLPDNVTAWQTTVHAVTTDLSAAATQTAVIATLPFFADVAVASDYVVGDRPQVLVRSFGQDISDDSITYRVTFPEYNDDEITVTGAAHESVAVALPDFSAGTYQIRVAAQQGSNQDAVIQSFTYHDSNITQNTSNYYRLEEGMDITGSQDGRTSLTFTNLERGQFFHDLGRMTWHSGDRIEQQLGRWGAQKLLTEYFDSKRNLPSMTFTDYQVPEGGISLLPYSSAELLLTAKAFLVAPESFDAISAQQYFESVLNSKGSNIDEVVYALLGMAALDQPVLTDINLLLAHHEIGPDMKLYLARAVAELGATEYAASILQEVLDQYGNEVDQYIRVEIGKTQDDYTEFSYQAAIIAAAVSSDQAPLLYRYAMDNQATYQLNTLDQLAYIQTALPLLSGDPVSFTYTLDGESQAVTLKNEDTLGLSVTLDQLDTLRFSNIDGTVGLIASFEEPINLAEAATDSNLSISRQYEVNGQQTTTFHENDIVKVMLTTNVSNRAIDNEYQMIDYLPAGLKLLTNLSSRNLPYEQLVQYPYEQEGQALKFWTGKGNNVKRFYYAVVTGKGTFIAESPTIQGFIDQRSVNYGTSQRVTIE